MVIISLIKSQIPFPKSWKKVLVTFSLRFYFISFEVMTHFSFVYEFPATSAGKPHGLPRMLQDPTFKVRFTA